MQLALTCEESVCNAHLTQLSHLYTTYPLANVFHTTEACATKLHACSERYATSLCAAATFCREAASVATVSGEPNKLGGSSTQARCQSHQRFTAEDGGRLTSNTSAKQQEPTSSRTTGPERNCAPLLGARCKSWAPQEVRHRNSVSSAHREPDGKQS